MSPSRRARNLLSISRRARNLASLPRPRQVAEKVTVFTREVPGLVTCCLYPRARNLSSPSAGGAERDGVLAKARRGHGALLEEVPPPAPLLPRGTYPRSVAFAGFNFLRSVPSPNLPNKTPERKMSATARVIALADVSFSLSVIIATMWVFGIRYSGVPRRAHL